MKAKKYMKKWEELVEATGKIASKTMFNIEDPEEGNRVVADIVAGENVFLHITEENELTAKQALELGEWLVDMFKEG